ncbi:phosphotransferase enzyme family protein [Natronogracilivirga saccharolytica]|uniref:Aminoglycoside phosphotransferase family protein n=1 Tax=Natronogracilivirga saccharolytica TaxID=2812953 RepID=A0A8J7UVU3_9BACT|nr:aminoglycoside phosphotransferase family protein [Natronogracilivirga saccharolytica]MBP3192902.1 aminoglycoside phosphotransferase family protein [Natronogracilivirga saccharolytica]
MNKSCIPSIFDQFATGETLEDYEPFGSGHIHQTWLIRSSGDHRPDYVLQKINQKIFSSVDGMMSNIQKVTNHIREKSTTLDKNCCDDRVLKVIPTRVGNSYLTDSSGEHWRLYLKVESGISYDLVPNEKVAYEAGKAFGQFITDLEDFPYDELEIVIPDFHSVEWRYEQLSDALKQNLAGRRDKVDPEITFARDQIKRMVVVPRLVQQGLLPERVTHNDTKLNNILFDQNDKAKCVIDLDTVMPGLVLYDFGDLIRTAANTAQEDEADLEQVQINFPVYEAITSGFFESTRKILTPEEADILALAGPFMAYLMGIRFLADYLNGDQYYHIDDPEQNLRRCRTQFRFIEHLLHEESECRKLIQNYYSNVTQKGSSFTK